MANYQLIFSPTGGTQRVAECLGSGLWKDAEEIDLLDPALEEGPAWTFSEGDVCLVAVPSFGGRVPAPAVRRLARMRGGGARAVLAVAYGNRAYDDTLLELQDVLREGGFRPVAAVAAVAEHSLLRPYRANGGLPLHPQGTGACTGCGQCAKICPVQAIDPAHPRKTDKDRCITCMACVARCPRKARRLNPFMQFVAGQKMKKVCGGRKPNALF